MSVAQIMATGMGKNRAIRMVATALLGLMAIPLMHSCKQRFRQSRLEATSDRLQESMVTIRGVVEVPAQPEFFVTNHLMNLIGFHLDHPDQATPPSSFDSFGALERQYQEDPKAGRPVIAADGTVDTAALKYWIAAQSKYTKKQFYDRGLSLTLDHILDDGLEVDRPNGATIRIKFKGVFRALKQVTASTSPLNLESRRGIARGEKITVPRDPATYFYREFASEFTRNWEAFGYNLESLDANGYLAVMRDMTSVARRWYFPDRDKAVDHKCFVFEYETVLSPFYLFYFFDASRPGCDRSLWTEWHVEEATTRPMDTGKFPEYDQLFAGDKPLDIFYFFGAGVSATREFNDLIPILTEKGFQGSYARKPDGTPDLTKPLLFTRDVTTATGKSVTVRLKYVDEENNPSARDEFRAALGYADVIYYGGHAGLGAKIDPSLADPESYASGKYQIIFLDGCSTYRYGMAEVLSAKALRDFDNRMASVDVIASYSIVSGWRQKDVILDTILRAAALVDAPENAWQPVDREQLSWLGIIKGMHRALDEQNARGWGVTGDYLVAGEENNQFAPGVAASGSGPVTQNANGANRRQQLEAFFRDVNNPQEMRAKALRSLLESDYQQSASLEAFTDVARSRCREFGRPSRGVTVLQELFWTETCQIRSIPYDRSTQIEYRGRKYSGGARLQELRYQSALRSLNEHDLDRERKDMLRRLLVANLVDVMGFHPDGSVQYGAPEFDVSFGKFRIATASTPSGPSSAKFVFWHENGAVAEAELAAPANERGVTCMAWKKVYFDESGSIITCEVASVIDLGLVAGPRQVMQLADFSERNVRLFGTTWADASQVSGTTADGLPFRVTIAPGTWLDIERAVEQDPRSPIRYMSFLSGGQQTMLFPEGYVFVVSDLKRDDAGTLTIKIASPSRYRGRDYGAGDVIVMPGVRPQ